MALHDTPPLVTGGLRSWMDAMLSGILRGLNAYAESRSRTGEIRELEAKSDAELARLGITRDQIPAYVFRDLMAL
ncbi:MAG: hypothetical protein ACLFRU_05150 [Paracoccaceae bacterium]